MYGDGILKTLHKLINNCHTLLALTGALVVIMRYYIRYSRRLFEIFTQLNAARVTLSRLNSINAIDATRVTLEMALVIDTREWYYHLCNMLFCVL